MPADKNIAHFEFISLFLVLQATERTHDELHAPDMMGWRVAKVTQCIPFESICHHLFPTWSWPRRTLEPNHVEAHPASWEPASALVSLSSSAFIWWASNWHLGKQRPAAGCFAYLGELQEQGTIYSWRLYLVVCLQIMSCWKRCWCLLYGLEVSQNYTDRLANMCMRG